MFMRDVEEDHTVPGPRLWSAAVRQLTLRGGMVTVREMRRAAARMAVRRNALRYLAIGVGASLVAACGGKGRDGSPAAAGTAAGASSPTPSATSSGVVARAFDAFVKGDWNPESTTPNGETVKGKPPSTRTAAETPAVHQRRPGAEGDLRERRRADRPQ
ncbi:MULTISPECIES: hypothetical protein [unclassified Streptomyces]|uniref:hypothetical protein n=1 Tax=unclassified Streptomyces TaxID=2593676 RepID=UPI0033311710